MRRSLLLLSALFIACGGSSKAPRKLVILHTNDEHSHLIGLGPEVDDFPTPAPPGSGVKGGASRRSVVLTQERDAAKAEGADTLTVSAGDNMMGSLAQIAATAISPDYRIMKVLGYDVTTLGNHEFDYGPQGLSDAIDAASANITGLPAGLPPIVASNIHFSGTSADAALAARYDPQDTDPSKPIHGKYVITTPSGIKVGFIGIMGADAAAVAPAAAPVTFSLPTGQSADNRIAALAQIFDDVQPVVDSLRRDDKVDLVVALSHGGVDPQNPAKSEDLAIAQNVAGIDVIVSGHSHTEFPATLVTNRYTHRQVLVQQAGRFGDNVGRIALTVNGDGTVTFDLGNSKLIPVTDAIAPTDATVNTIVGATVQALESQKIPGQQFSFLQYTLGEILGAAPPPLTALGGYYNFDLVTLPFDVDNGHKMRETELLDLSADAQLATLNAMGWPTEIVVEAAGVVRTPALKKGRTGKLGFADLFTAVPLGGSPRPNGSGTPGYPLCRFGIYLAEVKAAFEVTAGYAYTGHEDLYVVPSGFRFEYDMTRPAFSSSGDPLDPNNGRVTKMWQLKPDALAAGNLDGDANYTLLFDASLDAAHSAPGYPGWLDNPLRLVKAASSLYIATFATFAGVKLKALHDQMPSMSDGVTVPGNDATLTIVKRPAALGGTEIKAWEALGGYLHALGTVPPRYDKDDPATVLPRRAICVGARAVNGNCDP